MLHVKIKKAYFNENDIVAVILGFWKLKRQGHEFEASLGCLCKKTPLISSE